MKKYVDNLEAKGLIRPNVSTCRAPVLLIDRKNGGTRLCRVQGAK